MILVGSSGGSYSTPKAPAEAVKRLEDAMRGVGESKPSRNVFISFHVADEAQVNLLRQQAKNEHIDLEFRDYSVKEPFDDRWKAQCRDRIKQTSVTIVMIGRETANRPAVDWEIAETMRQGKPVVGIRISKTRNDPIPAGMKKHGSPVIDWNVSQLKDALAALN